MALVLSGGSVFGAVQVGHIRALLEAGIVPNIIVGCSVGALNGAYLAAGPDLQRLTTLEAVWRSLRTRDLFALRSTRTVANVVTGRDHLCDSEPLRQLIRRFCPVSDLSELPIEFHAATTDLDAARSVWWSAGPAVDVLAASTALPGIFSPVSLEGHRHVDGGVLIPVPVARAVELGADEIYVSDVSSRSRPRLPERLGALGVLLEAFNVARFSIDQGDEAAAPGRIVRLPRPDIEGLSMIDFSGTGRLIDDSYRLARNHLAGAHLAQAG